MIRKTPPPPPIYYPRPYRVTGAVQQLEVQPGKQLLQKALDVWKGPSMIIAGDDDPTVPTQVHLLFRHNAPLLYLLRLPLWF